VPLNNKKNWKKKKWWKNWVFGKWGKYGKETVMEDDGDGDGGTAAMGIGGLVGGGV
jgi:hypothetical protein